MFWPFSKNSSKWKSHPGAPAIGDKVCPSTELLSGKPYYCFVGAKSNEFLLVVITDGSTLRAFVANCPHRDLPLATAGGNGLYSPGEMHCVHHGASFSTRSGRCTSGPCKGETLISVPVRMQDDFVVIG